MIKKIGILATGNEVVDGDILNTNGQNIAQALFQHHIKIGQHVLVSDAKDDLISGLAYLLKNHDAIIITGGLGPTSDDATRFALSQVINQPLEFHEESWQAIIARLNRFGYKTVPENNKQQALFPAKATIFENPNGTARGCVCWDDNKPLFMLPGPPSECLPMFTNYVLPYLLSHDFATTSYFKKWLLFNVSEGEIADKLDKLTESFNRTTGYRIAFPYLEFKIFCDDQNEFNELVPIIEEFIEPHLVGNGKEPASQQLKEFIAKKKINLSIYDLATGGLLEKTLLLPSNFSNIAFNRSLEKSIEIQISGLTEYWRSLPEKTSILRMSINGNKKEITVPLRGERTQMYAVESICIELLSALTA